MSAIGEYVHYTAFGYLEHGTTRRGAFNTWSSQKTKVNTSFSQSKLQNTESLKEIEAIVNSIRENKVEGYSNLTSDIQKQIVAAYSNKIKGANLSKFTVDLANPSQDHIGKVERHLKDGRLLFDVKQVTIKLDKIQKLIAEKIKTGKVDMSVKKQVQQAKKLYRSIFGDSLKSIERRGYKSKHTPQEMSSAEIERLRVIMNNIISEYFQYPAVSLMEGTLFEAVLGLAGYVGSGAAMSNIKEELDKWNGKSFANVTGGITNILVECPNNFMQAPKVQQVLNEKGHMVQINNQGYIQRAQNKIDVLFEWKNEPIKISAKNIKIYNDNYAWVTVVSDSPLLVMIAGMDPDYINHYLNLYSTHKLPSGNTRGTIVDSNNIIDDLKYCLFYEGLTGSNFNNLADVANVFAVNDKLTGKIRLIDMSNILTNMEEKINMISVTAKGQNLKNIYFKNNWATTLDERIANILQQLHAIKITVKFNLAGAINLS